MLVCCDRQSGSENTDSWIQVLQALCKRLQYGRDQPLEDEVFNLFLAPVIDQLSFIVPDSSLGGLGTGQSSGLDDGLDVYGKIVVDSLVHMVVSASSDAQWKPLHHKVSDQKLSCFPIVCQVPILVWCTVEAVLCAPPPLSLPLLHVFAEFYCKGRANTRIDK